MIETALKTDAIQLINNTNVDKSVVKIHSTIISRI